MFKLIGKAKKNQKGFTLVELMVVVIIIGVLVAIAVPIYNNITTSAKKNASEANLRIIDGAIGMYSIDKQIDFYSINTTIGTAHPGLMDYLQAWPTGPDEAKYGVTDGKAVTDKTF